MEDKEKEIKEEKDDLLEHTKEMKEDIEEIQKDIDEVKETVKSVKKKGTFQSVLLTCVIILLFVAFALYGFATGIGYGIGKVKKSDKVITNSVYTFNNVDIEEVSEIYHNIQPMWVCDSPYFTDKKFTVNDITNEMAYTIGFKNLSEATLDEFTQEDLDNQIDALLGKDYKFTHKSYETCPYYKYSNKVYKLTGGGCGGTCGPNNIEKIVGASKNGNELDIYVAVLFIKVTDDSFDYYKDYNLKEKVTNYSEDVDFRSVADDTIENAKLGTTYKMVFNLVDDNYIFVSSEPMK